MPQAPKEERTEKPSAKKLNDARREGNVPQSQEMTSAVAIIVLIVVTIFAGPSFIKWTTLEMRQAFQCDYSYIATPQIFRQYLNDKIIKAMAVMAPFLATIMIFGITTNIMISGKNFSLKSLKLKFNILNPASGLKALFKPQQFVKFGFSVVKIIFIFIIVYLYLKDNIYTLATFQWIEPAELLTAISKFILGVLKRLCIGLLILGLIDLFYQKWKYTQNLMMTKKEVKDEARNADTPPEVKRRIRQKQFEAHMQRMLQAVPKADIVLVNPTHVAVALKYDPNTMNAPIVVAKGGDHLCEKIKEIARAYGVPIIRRPALARSIFATVKLEQPIPDSLFIAVAEVLALVHRLRQGVYSS